MDLATLSLVWKCVKRWLRWPRTCNIQRWASAGLSIRNEQAKLIHIYPLPGPLPKRRLYCAYCTERLRKKTRCRRSRTISFLELFSHATVVLTLTSLTCNCYLLPYTKIQTTHIHNTSHYTRYHVIFLRIVGFLFFARILLR